jgi:hypothetical protein
MAMSQLSNVIYKIIFEYRILFRAIGRTIFNVLNALNVLGNISERCIFGDGF